MTREEATQVLQEKIDNSPLFKDEREAYDMAIEALNEEDKRKQYGQNYEADDFVKLGVTDKNKDKVILYDAFGDKEYYPQTDLVRCKDCRHRDLFSCPLADNDFQKDEDFCSWGERREE